MGIKEHSLCREMIATQISNEVINKMGPLFVYRLQTEAGAALPDIIRGYYVVTKIFEIEFLQTMIESLSYKIDLNVQYELLHFIKHFIVISTRWFLRGDRLRQDLHVIIEHFSMRVKEMWDIIPSLMAGTTKEYLLQLMRQFVAAGLSEQVARRVAVIRAMYNVLNIIEIDSQYNYGLEKTAAVYFEVGTRFNLVWFRDQLAMGNIEGFWDILIRFSLRDELDVIQKSLTLLIFQQNKAEQEADQLLDDWTNMNPHLVDRWKKILEKLYEGASIDFSRFFVALKELSNLLVSRV